MDELERRLIELRAEGALTRFQKKGAQHYYTEKAEANFDLKIKHE